MRIVGVGFVMIGLGFLVADLVLAFGGEGGFALNSLGFWWSQIHLDSLLLLQPAIERHITPAIWDPGVQTLLEWPAAPQFLVLGIGLMLVFRRRRRPEGGAQNLKFGKR